MAGGPTPRGLVVRQPGRASMVASSSSGVALRRVLGRPRARDRARQRGRLRTDVADQRSGAAALRGVRAVAGRGTDERRQVRRRGENRLVGRADLGAGVMTMVAPPVSDRTMVESVMRRSFAITDAFHNESRAFRNRLVVTSLLAFSTTLAIIVLQWRLPDADIIQRPNGGEDVTRWALLILVMAFGAIGGLI